jgi:hypothetical protein
MLRRVLKHHEFSSSDETEELMTKVWDKLTFNERETVFHNWISRLAWVIENGGEHVIEQIRNGFPTCGESQNRRGDRQLSLHPRYQETVRIWLTIGLRPK